MEALDIFLKALEETFKGKRGIYVAKKATYDCKFAAFKRVVVEVWCVNGDYRTLVSSVESTGKYTATEDKKIMENKLITETIKSVLQYYGL